jgi:hypothetical protein
MTYVACEFSSCRLGGALYSFSIRLPDPCINTMAEYQAVCKWMELLLKASVDRDENSFRIFRNSGNRFRIFSIGITGNGIFRKRNRFLEFSIGIGIRIGVVFYRPFPSVTGFCRKIPDLCLGIFRNCVSDFFSELCLGIFRNFPACDFSHRLYVFR